VAHSVRTIWKLLRNLTKRQTGDGEQGEDGGTHLEIFLRVSEMGVLILLM